MWESVKSAEARRWDLFYDSGGAHGRCSAGSYQNLIYFFKECLWLLWRKWIEGSSRETSRKALAASQVMVVQERKEVAGLGVMSEA